MKAYLHASEADLNAEHPVAGGEAERSGDSQSDGGGIRRALAIASIALRRPAGSGGTASTSFNRARDHAFLVIGDPLLPLHLLCRSSVFQGSRGPPRLTGITWRRIERRSVLLIMTTDRMLKDGAI
jgi:hypothetical protein